jgi:hypothetical protein
MLRFSLVLKSVVGFMLLLGCDNSSRTPEYPNRNEAAIPEGNRAEDSSGLYGRDTGSTGKDQSSLANDGGSQKANDSLSGSRISSDAMDLKNHPTPESPEVRSRLKSHENVDSRDSL